LDVCVRRGREIPGVLGRMGACTAGVDAAAAPICREVKSE